MSGQKSPIFGTFRPPYTENFRQGLQPSQRRRIFRTRDPHILVGPPWSSCHPGDISDPTLLLGRLPGLAKEGGMLLLSLTKLTCALSLISNEGIN